jgi:hypothetical protein
MRLDIYFTAHCEPCQHALHPLEWALLQVFSLRFELTRMLTRFHGDVTSAGVSLCSRRSLSRDCPTRENIRNMLLPTMPAPAHVRHLRV